MSDPKPSTVEACREFLLTQFGAACTQTGDSANPHTTIQVKITAAAAKALALFVEEREAALRDVELRGSPYVETEEERMENGGLVVRPRARIKRWYPVKRWYPEEALQQAEQREAALRAEVEEQRRLRMEISESVATLVQQRDAATLIAKDLQGRLALHEQHDEECPCSGDQELHAYSCHDCTCEIGQDFQEQLQRAEQAEKEVERLRAELSRHQQGSQ